MSSDILVELNNTRDSDDCQSPLLEPFLNSYRSHNKLPQKRKSRRLDGLHFFSFLLSTVLTIFLIVVTVTHKALPTQSPAEDAIKYEFRYFDKYGHLTSPFSRKPGPELDSAWSNQLSGMNIAVSEVWLRPYNVDSVHLADGSGVLAQLGVYHELHCLKKIKHWIYRSYYYGNTSAINLEEEEAHIEHCLEWLRVAALCRGDTTLTTFRWGGEKGQYLETEYPIPRACVNGEKILEWSEKHAVDITGEGVLQGP
ncbi:hypothetical protein GGR53DRAFT_527080 [Hypoxylon sp. FL1150]|nr:hypothetical protein GGR53DRAFT_527080 [Hypoxylon sp. FL1150]